MRSSSVIYPRLSHINLNISRNDSSSEILKCTRKFVFSSFRVFSELVQEVESERNPANANGSIDEWFGDNFALQTHGLRASRMFRDNLRSMLFDINSMAETLEARGNDVTELYSMDNAIRQIERTWHLCEIFFLDSHSKLMALEIAKWLRGFGFPVDIQQQLDSFRDELAETARPDALETSSGYWTTIANLIFSGRLRGVITMLRHHSRFVNATASSQEGRALQSIIDVLQSHPFANYVAGPEEEDLEWDDVAIEENLHASIEQHDFAGLCIAWQEKCRRVRLQWLNSLPFLMPLGSLFEVMESGDLGACLHSTAYSIPTEWFNVGILKFLYAYTPLLSRSDILSAVESAFDVHDQIVGETDIQSEENRGRHLLRSTLRGNAGPLIKELYQYTDQLYSPPSAPSLSGGSALAQVAILSTAHLCYLLVHSAGLMDLLARLPNSSFGVDVGEELLLQAAQRLHELEYPIDIVVRYLKCCKISGASVCASLLSRTITKSDAEAIQVIRTLRSFDCEESAVSVCRSNAVRWLKRGTRHGLVRAIYFFELANTPSDTKKVCQILDNALLDICRIISSSFNSIEVTSGSGYHGQDSSKPIPMVFVPSPSDLDYPTQDSEVSLSAISSVLSHVDNLLGALSCEASQALPEATALAHYAYAVSAASALLVGADGQPLVSVPVGSGNSGFGYAARTIAALVSDAIPLRYKHHLIGLACWMADAHMVTNSAGFLCSWPNCRRKLEAYYHYVGRSRFVHSNPLTKSAVSEMIVMLSRMETGDAFKFFHFEHSELVPGAKLQNPVVAQLRCSLLSLYSSATLEANRTQGHAWLKIAHDAHESRRFVDASLPNTNSATPRRVELSGYECLVASI